MIPAPRPGHVGVVAIQSFACNKIAQKSDMLSYCIVHVLMTQSQVLRQSRAAEAEGRISLLSFTTGWLQDYGIREKSVIRMAVPGLGKSKTFPSENKDENLLSLLLARRLGNGSHFSPMP